MKRTLFLVLAMVFLFGSANDLSAQSGTNLPFMKITVKEGKVVSAEPLDTSRNKLTIMHKGVDQNARLHTSMSKDTLYSPDRAVRSLKGKTESVEAREKPEKGSSLPGRIELASEILDISTGNVLYMSGRDNDSKADVNSKVFFPEAGWEVITYEGYEGSFPSPGWDCYPASG